MADTAETILARLLASVPEQYDKTAGSFFYDMQMPLAIEHAAVYERIDGILNQGFAKTASDIYLDRKAAELDLTRKAATYASGSVTITGSPGSKVQHGAKVASDTATFTVQESATIPSGGSVTVAMVCDTPGKGGNLPPGAIKAFPVTLPGITAVTNTAAIVGGYDTESDEELRARYFKAIRPATSGNPRHYEVWAEEVEGVGAAKALPVWNGPGTVKVVVIDANKQPANAPLLESVRAKIEENRPIGADVTVASAAAVLINVAVALTLKSGLTTDDVRPKIQAAITAYLNKTAFQNSYISYAHIGGSILTVDGVTDFANLRVNNGTVNINVTETQVAVLGVLTLA